MGTAVSSIRSPCTKPACGGSTTSSWTPQRYELRSGDDVIRVEPQVFDVLTQLVSNHHRFVSKEELFDSVWGGRFVGEAALTSRIKAARRALGDDGESQRYIRTVRGRGYQFVGTIDTDTAHRTARGASEPEPAAPRQHIAFCRAADGVRLAYAVAGEGPPLVRAANWMTHLGYDIESPVWKHWVRDLSLKYASSATTSVAVVYLIGMQRISPSTTGSTDLESVVEALGLERFPLLGVSQGGAVAVAYAARHPERVSRPGAVQRLCARARRAGGGRRGKARRGIGSRSRPGRLGP